MQDWKVVEVIKGKSKLKYSGSDPQKAQEEYKKAAAEGTEGKLMLLDESGLPVEEFEAVAVANSGSLTGMPIREWKVPLPPELREAAARARLSPPILKCMRPAPPIETTIDTVPPSPETPPVVRWLQVQLWLKDNWRAVIVLCFVLGFALAGFIVNLNR